MPDGPITTDDRLQLFDSHRRYLFAVAYRMLGIAEDAEDILQDAWLRFSQVDPGALDHPRSYLVAVVSRLCLDQLKSARQQREEYYGVWLPEPVETEQLLGDDIAAEKESASFAFLLLLERLKPMQRVVLVLHEVFGYSHDEISQATETSVGACRQQLRRARQQLTDAPAVPRLPNVNERQKAEQFLKATRSGNVELLMKTLAPDVTLLSDGGGKVIAVPKPLVGRDIITKFFINISKNEENVSVKLLDFNAQPGALVYIKDELVSVFLFDISAERITSIYVVRNPEKLARLKAI
jgi:RNA polymerase sigma-70 factor (ECF subfamily)